MENLSAHTSAYLLQASLTTLHRESMEWLENIAFWKEESYFFYTLLLSKETLALSSQTIEAIKEMKAKIQEVSNGELNELENVVCNHERQLFALIKKEHVSEERYRDAHQHIAANISKFSKGFLHMKKQVFQMIHHPNTALNETLQTIYRRRSVRKYKPQEVDKQVVLQIVEAGKMAPTAMNRQSCRFHVLMDKRVIQACSEAIANVSKAHFHLIHPDVFVSLANEDPIFHHAPVVIFITSPRGDEWANLEVGMCAQNIMLAAKSMGLDTCLVGLGKYVEQTEIYPKLNIPPTEQIAISIALGHGDEQPNAHEIAQHNVFFI